ncbi:1-phosphofructokinase [Aquitalea magnusonii]|uniref:Phosphofructokinase n=1 Tax=Aquitalea magnusonii TaxID=332411 RepID=A0A318JIL7_9NEIS|nr:1-phosphofructokinase [Aquitalea magnusonii]PXX48810.1 fructose-1-phosphate kinase [Aquitalea magnusonii]
MNSPLITITLNPAIDQTVCVQNFQPGSVNLALSSSSNAGGKGVNVASCLADWGLPVLATGLLGRNNSEAFEALFKDKGIADRFIRVPGDTRVNIKLSDLANASTTDINLPGLSVGEAQWERLLTLLAADVNPGSQIVLAGSLPQGLEPERLPVLIGKLRQWGAHVLLDSSGAALATALAAPRASLPDCIKPNRHELEQWAGRALPTLDDVLACARQLQQAGVAEVVVSLGEQGALFVLEDGPALLARLPVQNPLSTVGAGDALVAGLSAARHQRLAGEERARLAVAFATAKLARIGPHLPERAEVEQLARQVEIQTLP